MLSERDAMARESSILIASAASDERLASALLEIEDLNKKLELEKYDHKEQVGFDTNISNIYTYKLLIHCGLVMGYGNKDLDQHRLS